MADSYMVDVNNREQIKEFLVYVSTSPDGVKMGAKAVSLMGSTPTDGKTPGNGDVVALLEGFNGTNWDKVRVANVFKYAVAGSLAANASATVWAPAANKKIRLMGAMVAAGAAGQHMLRMGAAGAGTVFAAAATPGIDSKPFDFGQGKLANVANDVLEIYNNNAAAVSYWVTVWGTEE